MKRVLPATLCLLLQGLATGQSPYASLQVPQQIQYQGRVATGTGAAWTGTEGYFVFALVQGATVLWNNWEGITNPSDPGTVSLGAGQVLTLPVSSGVFSIRLGEGSDTNEQIPPTVFFDATSNAVRSGVKLAVWFSPDGGTFTRLAPDVEFASVPFAMVAGIAETIKERTVGSTQLAEGAVQSPNIGLGAVGSAQIAIGGVQSANIADGSLTVSDFSSELREASVIPPGTILPFAGPVANVPAGWKVCDGSAVSRTTYATLFAAIGTSWGKGNGSSTFALPNLAGAMLAGTGTGVINGRNKVGPAIGAFQEDSMQGHWHTSVASSSASFGYSAPHIGINFNGTPSGISVRDATSDGSNIPPRTGLETRPYRAGVNYIIKL